MKAALVGRGASCACCAVLRGVAPVGSPAPSLLSLRHQSLTPESLRRTLYASMESLLSLQQLCCFTAESRVVTVAAVGAVGAVGALNAPGGSVDNLSLEVLYGCTV